MTRRPRDVLAATAHDSVSGHPLRTGHNGLEGTLCISTGAAECVQVSMRRTAVPCTRASRKEAYEHVHINSSVGSGFNERLQRTIQWTPHMMKRQHPSTATAGALSRFLRKLQHQQHLGNQRVHGMDVRENRLPTRLQPRHRRTRIAVLGSALPCDCHEQPSERHA